MKSKKIPKKSTFNPGSLNITLCFLSLYWLHKSLQVTPELNLLHLFDDLHTYTPIKKKKKKNSSHLWMKIDWFIFALQGVQSIQWHESIIHSSMAVYFYTYIFIFHLYNFIFSRRLFLILYYMNLWFSQTLQIYWMKCNPDKNHSNALQMDCIVIFWWMGKTWFTFDTWEEKKPFFSQWNIWRLTIDEWISVPHYQKDIHFNRTIYL